MVRKIINTAVLASMAVAGFAAVPAAAQDYYGRGGYYQTYDGGRYNGGEARQRYWQHERWEQRQWWEQERARWEYWQRQRYEHRGWGDHDGY